MTEPRRLGDRYELGEVLGYGGMAEVHRGRDVRLGRDVAIKTLRVDLARDPSFQNRFRREAQSAASLNHPAVVAVYDTGEDLLDGVSVPYIVMEYVDGRTLRDILKTEHRIMPNRALEIAADVLRALDYSHRSGIVHRDIKPANVMLTRAGEVKVMDFGIARAVAQSAATVTQTAAVIGTAQYLSPEQARGEHVDPRSDIYSTGCLLYELLTGTPPFTGDSPVAVAYQHVREDPVPPSRLNPDVTPAVDSIVIKSMAKNPANRYQTAAEMREDIERALAGYPVHATPLLTEQTMRLTPVAPATPPEEQRPRGRGAVYALLGIAVIVVAVAIGLVVNSVITGGGTASVQVPDVVGKTQQQATDILEGHGFQVNPKEEANDAKAGTVFDQDPPRGTTLDKGKTVTIKVSTGPASTTVPADIVGRSLSDVVNILGQQGLKVAPNPAQQDSPQAKDTVLSANPAPGQSIDKGGTVTLTIASGSNKVPYVRDLPVDQASQQLADAGFTPKPVEQTSSSGDPDTVLNQSPAAGSSQPVGSTITIYVAKAPVEKPTPTPNPTPTPQTSSSPSTPPTGSGGGDGGTDKSGKGSGSTTAGADSGTKKGDIGADKPPGR